MFAVIYVSAQNIHPHTLSEVEVSPPAFTAVKVVEENSKESIDNYIAKEFRMPPVIGTVHEGTEVVQFVVNPSGKLSDFNIINSVSPEVDQEIIRVLQTTNNMWIPGKNNGIPVAMEKEIAVAVKTGTTDAEAFKKDFMEIARTYFTRGAKKLYFHGKTKNALKQFEIAIRYKPYDKGLLMLRALCKMELGETEAAKQDLARIKKLGGIDSSSPYLSEDIKKIKSYEEIAELLAIQ